MQRSPCPWNTDAQAIPFGRPVLVRLKPNRFGAGVKVERTVPVMVRRPLGEPLTVNTFLEQETFDGFSHFIEDIEAWLDVMPAKSEAPGRSASGAG